MVLVRFATKVLTRAIAGDTLPDPSQTLIDVRNEIKRFRASQTGKSPREVFKRVVTDRAAEQVEQLISRSEAGSRLIKATRSALEGPREGPGTLLRRTQTFLSEIRRE